MAASLCANGVLLAARWRASLVSSPPSAPASYADAVAVEASGLRPDGASASGRPVAVESVAPGAASRDAAGGRPGSFWASLDRSDPRAVLASLRAAGWPEDDVRTVVSALVRERYKDRIEAAQRSDVDQPYWKTREMGFGGPAYAERIALWRELDTEITNLLGPEPLDPLNAARMRQHYGPMDDETLAALQRLERDYGDLVAQARSSSWGPPMPWDRDAVAFVEAERRRDLEALLSPEELQLYDLHTSSTAHNLRRQLAGFNATESEFRALFALQQQFDQQYNPTSGAGTAENRSAAEKARSEMVEQIKSTLGETRFAEYERATDAGFQAALSVTSRLNLPAESATTAYTLAQDTRAAVKALNRDESLTPVDRAAAMGRLLQEANAQLDTLLTTSGAAVFRTRSNPWRYVEAELRQKQGEAR